MIQVVKKRGWLILILSMMAFPTLGQNNQDFNYRNELVWGLAKSTNSRLIGSGFARFSLQAKEGVYQTFTLEIANIKHPQEVRRGATGSTGHVVGKVNYLFPVRLQYGRDWILFRKAAQQGVQLNAGISGGPTLGFETPYVINYVESGSRLVRQQYDPAIHIVQDNIQGTAGPLAGLPEANVVPGANIKLSLSFEFGTYKSRVSGFETGVMLEAYTRPIEMMAFSQAYQVFPSAYVALYYGLRN